MRVRTLLMATATVAAMGMASNALAQGAEPNGPGNFGGNQGQGPGWTWMDPMPETDPEQAGYVHRRTDGETFIHVKVWDEGAFIVPGKGVSADAAEQSKAIVDLVDDGRGVILMHPSLQD